MTFWIWKVKKLPWGKPVGRDLAKGKMTLPSIRALAAATGSDRDRLCDIIQRHDRVALCEVLEHGGWINAARVTAGRPCGICPYASGRSPRLTSTCLAAYAGE